VTPTAACRVLFFSFLSFFSRKKLPFSVMTTVTDQVSSAVDPADWEKVADVLVFPQMVRYPAVAAAALPALIEAECVQRRRAQGLKVERISCSVVLVCNHKSRDDRCGISGPVLITEFSKYAVSFVCLLCFISIHIFTFFFFNILFISLFIFVVCCSTLQDKQLETTLDSACEPLDAKAQALPLTPTAVKGVAVIGTSHVGGHKWAGNVLVYPHGRWYARVTPCHVHTIVDAELSDPNAPPVQPLLRGTILPLPSAASTAPSTAASAAPKAGAAAPASGSAAAAAAAAPAPASAKKTDW
jgi:(2Fe-2S) ferredoxin